MHEPACPTLVTRPLATGQLAAFVEALPPHELRCLVGVDAATLAEHLTLPPRPRRPVLRLDVAGPGDAAALIARAVDELARAVAGLWPYLWGGEDFSTLRDDPLTLAHLPLRVEALAACHPGLSRAWACAVVARLLRGASPRLAPAAPQIEWPQLVQAFAPGGLVVAVPWRPHVGATAFVAALEWLARHAPVAVLVLADEVPAAFERLAFGAAAVAASQIEPSCEAKETPPEVIALPDTEGRPHPQSAAELRLYTLIQADPDLRPLFAFNKMVPDLPLLAAKADVLWRQGRLVVEIDGPEHRGATKYRADRKRDAILLLAGWRVLRFTNEDIITDAALAVSTIRDAVRLVQGEAR